MNPDQSGRRGELTDNDLDQLLAAANEELLAHIKAVADPTSTLITIMTRAAAATPAGSAASATGSTGTRQAAAEPTADTPAAAVRPSKQDVYDDEFTDLYRKYAVRVHGYLINMGTDRGLAEEITDDAFLTARRRWSHVRALERPEAYVYKIARNERMKRQPAHDRQARDLHPDPSEPRPRGGMDPGHNVPDRLVLQQALQQLPSALREAVALRDVEDFAVDTAAEIMNISPGAVKRYTLEGRRRLRSLLADSYDISEEGTGQ